MYDAPSDLLRNLLAVHLGTITKKEDMTHQIKLSYVVKHSIIVDRDNYDSDSTLLEVLQQEEEAAPIVIADALMNGQVEDVEVFAEIVKEDTYEIVADPGTVVNNGPWWAVQNYVIRWIESGEIQCFNPEEWESFRKERGEDIPF